MEEIQNEKQLHFPPAAELSEKVVSQVPDRPGKTDTLDLRISSERKQLAIIQVPIVDGQSKSKYDLVKDSESAYAIFKTKEFVDEAMTHLTKRGNKFYVLASVFSVTSFACLGAAVWHTINNGPVSIPKDEVYTFWLHVVHVLSFAGLYLIGFKLSLSLAKAFLHEAVKNFERRHAMRFGRLYVELKGRDWQFDELEDAGAGRKILRNSRALLDAVLSSLKWIFALEQPAHTTIHAHLVLSGIRTD